MKQLPITQIQKAHVEITQLSRITDQTFEDELQQKVATQETIEKKTREIQDRVWALRVEADEKFMLTMQQYQGSDKQNKQIVKLLEKAKKSRDDIYITTETELRKLRSEIAQLIEVSNLHSIKTAASRSKTNQEILGRIRDLYSKTNILLTNLQKGDIYE